jgi:hypothetical protein
MPITPPVQDGFLGLAFEYSTIPAWAGSGAEPVNPVLVRLIRALDPVGRPNVRIGGQSTDHSWWPVHGMRQPPGVVYSLGPSWTLSARALAQALDANLVLGVNLDADRPRIDQVEAHQFLSRIGRRWIQALTIGNEPPLYSVVPYYRVLGGQVLPWYEHVGQPVLGGGRAGARRTSTASTGECSRCCPTCRSPGPTRATRRGSPRSRSSCRRPRGCGS